MNKHCHGEPQAYPHWGEQAPLPASQCCAPPHGLGAWMRSAWPLRALRTIFRTSCRAAFCASLVLMPAPIAHSNSASNTLHEEIPSEHHHAAQQWLHALGAVSGAWQPVQTLTWFGRPLWLRQFVMTQDLGEAAQQLTQAAPALDRILTGPNTLLLSGIVGSLHLVVQLQRTAQGLVGFASVLDASPSIQALSSYLPDAALGWLPLDTPMLAAQWWRPDGSRVRQFIHVVAQTPDQLRARLHTPLTRQGWQETLAVTGKRDVAWQRREDHLYVMADRSGQGSVIYQSLMP